MGTAGKIPAKISAPVLARRGRCRSADWWTRRHRLLLHLGLREDASRRPGAVDRCVRRGDLELDHFLLEAVARSQRRACVNAGFYRWEVEGPELAKRSNGHFVDAIILHLSGWHEGAAR